MATTTPEGVRRALQRVTGGARAELQAVAAAAAQEPSQFRAAMFAATPLIVSEYAPGASTLALDWFEEIREEAAPKRLFTPTPRLRISDEDVAASVARTTERLRSFEREFDAEVERLMAEATSLLEAEVQKQVAAGFRDTITENADDDPDAAGWRRYAREGACKFCLMLAERGAVYTRRSVNFAAHTNCHCVVGPNYDLDAPRASVIQYVASRRTRSPEQMAAVREYLNHNFPDAPG